MWGCFLCGNGVTFSVEGDAVVLPADLVKLARELLFLAVGLIIIHSKKLYRRWEWKVILWAEVGRLTSLGVVER